MYFGSTWKDWGVWQAAPWIAHRLGCRNAFAVEYDNVSHGSPAALRLARDLLRAEEELRSVLLVGACRESYLLDYGNERSRFMFSFGDGAVAALLVTAEPERQRAARRARDHRRLVLAAGQGGPRRLVEPDGSPFLDVADPGSMKERPRRRLAAELRRRRARARSSGRARASRTSRSSARCT